MKAAAFIGRPRDGQALRFSIKERKVVLESIAGRAIWVHCVEKKASRAWQQRRQQIFQRLGTDLVNPVHQNQDVDTRQGHARKIAVKESDTVSMEEARGAYHAFIEVVALSLRRLDETQDHPQSATHFHNRSRLEFVHNFRDDMPVEPCGSRSLRVPWMEFEFPSKRAQKQPIGADPKEP
jgi:hypothetical protein